MHLCASGNNPACILDWRCFFSCVFSVIGCCSESDDEITMVSMVSGILFYILLHYRDIFKSFLLDNGF